MTQTCSYPGYSSFATDVNFLCLLYRLKLGIVLPWIQVLYVDFQAIAFNRQNVPRNYFWFKYCLFSKMNGLYVTLTSHGLVDLDIPDSSRSKEFHCETINCLDHVSLLHQGLSNDCVVC